MKVGGLYSFNGGLEAIQARYSQELAEIQMVIQLVDATHHKTKSSLEKTMPGKLLYKPGSLNHAFKRTFAELNWQTHRIRCDYPGDFYTSDYVPTSSVRGAFREIDFVKNKVGVEVQFGKYAFMVYNVCAKMTIFHNEGIIDAGVEIVPLKELANEMST
ncbi:MAG TPA: BglII/BstYI family type II restriction endonuclease, partial [Chloroflexota bacterium]|nr:BglII/BstYI family type II restriction endonuclease [Chloroflexota bacterium]